MRLLQNIKWALLGFAAFSSLAGCVKGGSSEGSVTYNFDAFLKSRNDLTLFDKMVTKAGVDAYKNGPGPFTWFVPNDAAMTEAGINSDSIDRMTPGFASYLALSHMVREDLPTFQMISQYSVNRTAATGVVIYTGERNDTFYLNGAPFLSADNRLTNGNVHVIGRFATPPALRGNLQAVLTNTGQHSLFITALQKTGLWAQLATASVFTVLAPTDAAMIAAGYTSAAQINALTGAALTTLTNQMRYHYFLGRRVFTNDLRDGSSPITGLAGKLITVKGNGTILRGVTNSSDISITSFDRQATNGVLHVINGVLRP